MKAPEEAPIKFTYSYETKGENRQSRAKSEVVGHIVNMTYATGAQNVVHSHPPKECETTD